MKVTDTIRAPGRSATTARTAATTATKAVGTAARTGDVIAPSHIMGIPVSELTPKVRDVLMSLMQEVESLRRELEHTREKMTEAERAADTDTLSSIANRRGFVRELARVMSYAERYRVETSLLFFDVDGLKAINDTHGHAAGDVLLVHIADVLQANVRTSDVVGRLGGDEFAVVLSHANEAQAIQKADFLQSRIGEAPVQFEGESFVAAASVGVYTFGPGETTATALAAADKKMYSQKQARRAAREKAL
jgi:diguanylate cyclase (GGDEF)-like protein